MDAADLVKLAESAKIRTRQIEMPKKNLEMEQNDEIN